MNKLESALITTAVNYLSTYINQEKSHVIEPITCMIRLAMLGFKPKGTKICIFDNSIYIQEPSVFQGPIRWMSGDNRNDIHYLMEPINKALKRCNSTNSSASSENLKNIYKLAMKGLVRLKSSYAKYHNTSSLTSHCIELYIKTIQDHLEGNQTEDSEGDDEESKTYNFLGDLWSEEQLRLINQLFQQCTSDKRDSSPYLKAIENILDSKVKATKEILVKNMSNII